MADVLVASDATTNNGLQGQTTTVWTSTTTGYVFYFQASPVRPVYRKTTDSGETWSDKVELFVPDSTPQGLSVWPDWATPGDSGTKIHIAIPESGNPGLFKYITLDTTDDSLGSVVTYYTTSLATGTSFGEALSIVKARGGNIYIAGGARRTVPFEPYFVRSTDGGASFASRDMTPFPAGLASIQLAAGNETDPNDILAFFVEPSPALTAYTYDDSGDSWSAGTAVQDVDGFEGASPEYVAITRRSDNLTFLTSATDVINQEGTGDLTLWSIDTEASITRLPDIETNNDNITGAVDISIDVDTGDVIVVYGLFQDVDGGDFDTSYHLRAYNGASVGKIANISESAYSIVIPIKTATRLVETGVVVGVWASIGPGDIWYNRATVPVSRVSQTQVMIVG